MLFRSGFNVLLEWGHTIYYANDNDGTFLSKPDWSLANDFLNGKGSKFTPDVSSNGTPLPTGKTTKVNYTYVEFLEKIQDSRIKSCGNYDAMFGRVSNYHWSFLPDGSYDITIDLVSVGEIIESFKINALTVGINKSIEADKTDPAKQTDKQFITTWANKNDIGIYFWKLVGKQVKDIEIAEKIEKNQLKGLNVK